MIRQLLKLDPDLRAGVMFWCAHCPAGCRVSQLHFPSGIVYRSSRRSLTMRCAKCGLLWTMTVHQIAKAAARRADADPDPRLRAWAAPWAEWAAAIDDPRGRRSRAAPADERAEAPDPDADAPPPEDGLT